MVSYGNASGAVDAFDLGVLSRKGSLYVTRPTLFSYISTREDLLACADDLFAVMVEGAVVIDVNRRFRSIARPTRWALEGRETTGSTLLVP